jgi:hypothetical protein
MRKDKQQFQDFLKDKGFTINEVSSTFSIIPHHRKTDKGHHNIIQGISVCIWGGKGTPKGGLGCISFEYTGIEKRKFKRHTNDRPEILKKALVCNTVKEAITAYDNWIATSWATVKSWETIL